MVHKTIFGSLPRHVNYEFYQPFDGKSLIQQIENDCKKSLKSFVTRASLKMYMDCSCGFCVVCEELEDNVQEWCTCGFDYNQFSRNKKML